MKRSTSWLTTCAISLLAFGPSSCTLTRESADCASTTECREAFGTGYVCAAEGLCELAPVNVACTAQMPADLLSAPEKYRDYVVLGSLLRAEGKEGARNDSAKLAIDSVNRYLSSENSDYHELDGLRFGLVQCNHDGNIESIAELAKYLVDTVQVPAILGPASSSATSHAFKNLNLSAEGEELRNVLFISPSATSLALSDLEQESPGMLWRTAPTDDSQGRLMGEFATELSEPFLAFYEDTPYGRGLFEQLSATSGDLCDECGFMFDADTGSVVPLTQVLAKDETLAALSQVKLIYFMGAQESHVQEMMKRLSTDKFAGKIVFFSDAAASSDTANTLKKNFDQVIGTRVRAADGGEATRFFAAAYQGTHDEDPLLHSFTAHSYDAAWLLLLSGLRARLGGDSITAETLATGLREMSDPDWAERSEASCPLKLNDGKCPELTLDETYLPEILEALDTERKVNVQGASGTLEYDAKTEELLKSAHAFEYWHLEQVVDEEVGIVGGKPLN